MNTIKCIKTVEIELDTVRKEIKRIKDSSLQYDEEYINSLVETERKLSSTLSEYKQNLKSLPEVESRLYYKIMYEGMSVNKAIAKVSEENIQNDKKPCDIRYIERKYYPKIKKLLKI